MYPNKTLNLIGLKWPGQTAKSGVKSIQKELVPLKKALRDLAWEGEEGHDGPLIDLATLISAVIRTYEHKGIHYTLQTKRVRINET